jgi:hypothetical protein
MRMHSRIIIIIVLRCPHLVSYFGNECRIIALLWDIIPGLERHDAKARIPCHHVEVVVLGN